MNDPVPEEAAAVFARSAIARHLGIRLHACGNGAAELSMPVAEHLLQEDGAVQGGVLSVLADAAAVYSLHPYGDADRTMTSVEFKVNFLRPALPAAGDLVARARVVHRGRRTALAETDLFQGTDGAGNERHVVHGTFTYMFVDR